MLQEQDCRTNAKFRVFVNHNFGRSYWTKQGWGAKHNAKIFSENESYQQDINQFHEKKWIEWNDSGRDPDFDMGKSYRWQFDYEKEFI